MSFTSDLLTGLASYLASAGIGVTYRPSAPYLASETGVFFGQYPTAPNRCIVLTAYAVTDQPKIAASRVRVEFALRGIPGDSLDVGNLGDDIFGVMQGLEHQQWGTAHMVQALRAISNATGVDDSKRSTRSDSYNLDINTPVTAGRPY